MYHPSVKEKMTELEAHKAELTALLADGPSGYARLSAERCDDLCEQGRGVAGALGQSDERPEAADACGC
ncbi:hypothetical protein [uncultured Bosea sp.]|uniref:hypothetical protein n=1 Tax=uncultured Bosea sp. TaxID=211457 RepID=UPI0025F31B84|nr:hypothetical protein [uncultured Bosea sp.]